MKVAHAWTSYCPMQWHNPFWSIPKTNALSPQTSHLCGVFSNSFVDVMMLSAAHRVCFWGISLKYVIPAEPIPLGLLYFITISQRFQHISLAADKNVANTPSIDFNMYIVSTYTVSIKFENKKSNSTVSTTNRMSVIKKAIRFLAICRLA